MNNFYLIMSKKFKKKKKMRGYPEVSFWVSIALAKIYFHHIVVNNTKNISFLGVWLNFYEMGCDFWKNEERDKNILHTPN